MLGDWVVYRLSGVFSTDPSLGSSSNLFDLATRDWSPETRRRRLDLPDILPPVFESGTVIGEVTPEAAAATGLRPGHAGRGRGRATRNWRCSRLG